jgi:hypothetical protein
MKPWREMTVRHSDVFGGLPVFLEEDRQEGHFEEARLWAGRALGRCRRRNRRAKCHSLTERTGGRSSPW